MIPDQLQTTLIRGIEYPPSLNTVASLFLRGLKDQLSRQSNYSVE